MIYEIDPFSETVLLKFSSCKVPVPYERIAYAICKQYPLRVTTIDIRGIYRYENNKDDIVIICNSDVDSRYPEGAKLLDNLYVLGRWSNVLPR